MTELKDQAADAAAGAIDPKTLHRLTCSGRFPLSARRSTGSRLQFCQLNSAAIELAVFAKILKNRAHVIGEFAHRWRSLVVNLQHQIIGSHWR